ncbi:MAG TPA: NUDIX domain-containing protein [Acidimicrobiales bacterium]|jgi:8-oxo-dGTP pyrophosphatase MutT (NUDIX family)|nr:NUDIX domain-containing protein [Acidimicrobiales bacterium]
MTGEPTGDERETAQGSWGADRLRRLVAGHVPADAREAASGRRFVEELGRLARPCDEDADPVHVTASAVVAGRRGTVLHLHRRLHRWLQPGGHIEPGESPSVAALREAGEETGLVAGRELVHPAVGPRLVHLDVHQGPKGHLHLDLRFLLLGADREPSPPPGESPVAGWYDWEEAMAMGDESLGGALRAARTAWEAAGRPVTVDGSFARQEAGVDG